MLSKTAIDEIEPFLLDASNMPGGHASRVVFPESTAEVAELLAQCSRDRVPVTVAGAGTGVVGGRVPLDGIVLSTARLNKHLTIENGADGAFGIVDAGVILLDYQRAADQRGLLYPPDPTEWSCYIGGTVATNASGARTFKYGPTRAYVRRLRVVLADGTELNLKRGDAVCAADGSVQLRSVDEKTFDLKLPSYEMPRTRKHAAGYFSGRGMDAIDLFIGSEGTLGVITEVETRLLTKPEGLLAGVVFFADEANLLEFVRAARSASLETRAHAEAGTVGATVPLDARALEFFDRESLEFLREKFPAIPQRTVGAIYFEQETSAATEDELLEHWCGLLEKNHALLDESWFATDEKDQKSLKDFRHALPVQINEWLTRHGQRKVSTDMAVPDAEFAQMLQFYKDRLHAAGLKYVIFGHIGDNHVHVNMLPLNSAEAATAKSLYGEFVARAVKLGGTISAEHGIGKLKRAYLPELYDETALLEMARVKKSLDPACILGLGNLFDQRLLDLV